MRSPEPLAFAESDDSLGELADALARAWRPQMQPLVAAIGAWIARQPSLAAARDGLAGLLPKLPNAQLRKRVQNGQLQARLAGRAGLAVTAAEAAEPAFAEGDRVTLKPLTDAEAVRYLTGKNVGGRFSFDWRDVRDEEHVSSFVVAKAMNASLLGDIHQGVVKALEQGWSRDRFVSELTPMLQQAGWWGEKEATDPVTGERRLVQLGSPRRLKTIYDVNLRQAHAAGRWERMVANAQPGDLLRYTAVMDERTRVQHRAWHGTTLPITHPFWATHYPPCGWNCRCQAILIPASKAARQGIAPTSAEDLAKRGFGRTTPWPNTRTGEVEQVPFGIDPGFGYNAGEARLQAFNLTPEEQAQLDAPPAGGRQVTASQSRSGAGAMPSPRMLDAQPDGGQITPAEWGKAFFEAFGDRLASAGEGPAVFTDEAQLPLVVSDDLFEDRYGVSKLGRRDHWPDPELLAEAIMQPDEIWVSIEDVLDAAGRVIAKVTRRRYIAQFELPTGDERAALAVFEEDGSGWRGITAYSPGSERSGAAQLARLQKQRVGVRVYRRKG